MSALVHHISSEYIDSSIAGFIAVLLFVPETKALSLEELDQGLFPDLCFTKTII
jgi:hypothetical protein